MDWSQVVMVVVMAAVAYGFWKKVSGSRPLPVELPLEPTIAGLTTFDEDARAKAVARARALASDRSWSDYLKFAPEDSWYRSEYSVVYLMAYELMMRGIDCRLEMAEQVEDDIAIGDMVGGGQTRVGMNFRPYSVYTTGLLAPHIGEISDVHSFDVYVPSRDGHDYDLMVAPEDIEEAFALARELKVRMAMLWHPEQGTWWHESSPIQAPKEHANDFKFHK